MLDYSAQVSPRDRWCIAAYIRALQLSQNATMADVPQGQSIPSKAPEFVEPGTRRNSAASQRRREIRERGIGMSTTPRAPHPPQIDLSPPPIVKTIGKRSLIIGAIAS